MNQKDSLFRFALISDTHDAVYCGLGQELAQSAAQYINTLRPSFVVGVGDLVSGGGDLLPDYRKASLQEQLVEFKEKVLKELSVPFIPISGNHDLEAKYSSSADYVRSIWRNFWLANEEFILPCARRSGGALLNHRFEYAGIGFSILTYCGDYGLYQEELDWIDRNVQEGDFCFRHVNPFGIAESNPFFGGLALRDYGIKDLSRLPRMLLRKKVRALFSGHTHAFYDGISEEGLRFVNTGSLGKRAMAYIKGWRYSSWKNRQAFVIVDVFSDKTFSVNFYVWSEYRKRFELFNKKNFPRVVEAKSRWRILFREGAAARFLSCRS